LYAEDKWLKYLALGFVVLFVAPYAWIQTYNKSSVDDRVQSVIQSEEIVASPKRLQIPSLRIDALIEPVGLTPEGAMDVPTERTDVAWFTRGPRPGESGTAVISGHYSSKNWQTSTFDTLYKIRIGDTVTVENDTGETVHFVVRAIERFDSSADSSLVFTSTDNKAHLNLVTCEGEWDAVSKNYSTRLIVFADKAP